MNSAFDVDAHKPESSETERLKVGFVLMPDFTLLAFTGFIEVLRQAADMGDKSRHIWCDWSVMNHNLDFVSASCGVTLKPDQVFQDPKNFDYIVLVGGLLSTLGKKTPELVDYIVSAAQKGVSIIGLCTASFTLAEAGLLKGRRCGVHWYHYQDFKDRFPEAIPVIDELFVTDGNIITSPGGTSTTDLALHLISKHFGAERVLKVLRHMILDWNRPVNHPQIPYVNDYAGVVDPRVRRAIFFMEQNLTSPINTAGVAAEAHVSARQLERLFQTFLSESPAEYLRKLRLKHANWLLRCTRKSITEVAMECGFADSSHFTKKFKEYFGITPGMVKSRPWH